MLNFAMEGAKAPLAMGASTKLLVEMLPSTSLLVGAHASALGWAEANALTSGLLGVSALTDRPAGPRRRASVLWPRGSSCPPTLSFGVGPSCRPASTPDLVVLDDDDSLAFEVIEAIRNLPDCPADSLDISFELVSSSPRVVSNKMFDPISDEVVEECSSVPRVRCRLMDVDSCDSILSRDEFHFLQESHNSFSPVEFPLPSPGDRIKIPPPGFFTVYSVYFFSGLFLPPHPLLLEIVRSVGRSIYQFTPNSFMYFLGPFIVSAFLA
ncbi:UNVERIFIED_CONTAM: hypothetical protein Sangu_0201100 [Sesamum angustifolium]|uniref:Uncharacterized protein n=1 Tax=Sesamum angustifolium TaxID=2727405 RepID=A0AAW2RN75_9LAMI